MTIVRKISPTVFPGTPTLACRWQVRADGRLDCIWERLPRKIGNVVRLDDRRVPRRLHGSVTPPGEDRPQGEDAEPERDVHDGARTMKKARQDDTQGFCREPRGSRGRHSVPCLPWRPIRSRHGRGSMSAAMSAICSAMRRRPSPIRSASDLGRYIALWHLLRWRTGGLRALLLAPDAGPAKSTLSFPGAEDLAQVLSYRATAAGTANQQLEYLASLRGRIGYGIGPWTPFVTGGIAWASTRSSRTDLTTGNEDASPSNIRAGYVLGLPASTTKLDSNWSARAEYLYTSLPLNGFVFATPARYDSLYDLHRIRLGLNYKFGAKKDSSPSRPDRGFGSWEIHTVRRPSSSRRLSAVQRRLLRRQQPAARGPEPRDLDGLGASSASGSGRAPSSTTIQSCCRASALPTRPAPAAIPTARRRSPTSPIHATTPRGSSCVRRSVLVANARRSQATMASSRASATCRESPCRSASSR